MADHKKRVELLEDDDFKFLSDDHDVSNHQNGYVYTDTERQCTQEGWKPNSHGNGYTSQNLHSYLRTMPVKSEEIEGSNLDIKDEIESQISDLNVNCEPHYETHAPYPTRSVIKEELDIHEEPVIKEEYLIPDSNTNGGLSASRVPDYMLESRSDLKEEIEENQTEAYGPLYASHVGDPTPNMKEAYEPGGYRPLYASCEYPMSTSDVTYKPESTELQSDLGIMRPLGQNIQPSPQSFNMTASFSAPLFQELPRKLGLTALLSMPNVSQTMSGLINRPNHIHGTSHLQSNMFSSPNTAPGNSICATEPRANFINMSPLLKSNISNRESNTTPNAIVRAISKPNLTYDIPQWKSHISNRVPNTALATTNNCVTDPIPNHNHGLPQIKPNMSNRGANPEPNTIVRAMESLSLAHSYSQLQSNTSNTSSHTIHNTMPCLTNTAQITLANTTRNTEMRPNSAFGPSQIQSNMFKRVPNTANTTVCGTSPKPTVEVTELIANGPQLKLNISNNPTNIVRADLRHHLNHTSPQSESSMSNKKTITGPNTVCATRPNSAGSSHPNMDPLQATLENLNDGQCPASNENSQSKYYKRNKNFFDWEKQLRGSIMSSHNDSVKRNHIVIKATTNKKPTNPPVKCTIGKRITFRYICTFCSCIYTHAPTCERHMTRQHHVKADRLWKQICTYIQCRYCLSLIVRQSYKNHVKSHNQPYYNYYKSIKQ